MSIPSLRNVASFLAAMAFVTFALNWFWEMAQMRAYTQMETVPWTETLLPCTWAAAGDVAFALLVYGIGATASGNLTWALTGHVHVLIAAAFLGALIATAYEWRSQLFGPWTYADTMLTVPGLRVGLWPLLQLTITIPTAFAAARFWFRRNERSGSH